MVRDILITTAGTSLMGNLAQLPDGSSLKNCLTLKKAPQLARELCLLDENERICGAEINSVSSILAQNLLHDRFFHIILVSDTEPGDFVGQVLEHYYTTRHNKKSRFTNVEVYRVEGLTSHDARTFKNQGLKNLVRLMGSTVRAHGPHRILINATGGYKAQISFAGMIGQALDIPVCYMFEKFGEVIILPPQPVSFDFDFWLAYYPLFSLLNGVMEKDNRWDLPDERFQSLVDYIAIDGKHLYELTPTGQLFHETFRSRFKFRKKELLPAPSMVVLEDRKITFEDGNHNKHKGLKRWLEKIIAVDFVNGIYTHYYNPDLERGNDFRRTKSDSISELEGYYSNNGALTKFTILTTAKNMQQRNAAIVWLNENFAVK